MAYRLIIGLVLVCALPSSVFAQDANGKLKVYLDCDNCFGDYIREEVNMVEYVRDPAEADVHIIVSQSDTGSGGIERAVALIGLGRFKGMDFKSRAISQSGDTEDTQRQRLATAITIGLLNYLASDGVKGGLTVEVEQTAQPGQAGPAVDPVELLGDEPAGIGRHDRRRKQPRARPRAPSSARIGSPTSGRSRWDSRSNTAARISISTRTNRCAPSATSATSTASSRAA